MESKPSHRGTDHIVTNSSLNSSTYFPTGWFVLHQRNRFYNLKYHLPNKRTTLIRTEPFRGDSWPKLQGRSVVTYQPCLSWATQGKKKEFSHFTDMFSGDYYFHRPINFRELWCKATTYSKQWEEVIAEVFQPRRIFIKKHEDIPKSATSVDAPSYTLHSERLREWLEFQLKTSDTTNQPECMGFRLSPW